jgi:glycosyltransferase involved in cell wall biosynthesis
MNQKVLYILVNFSKKTTFILNELLALQKYLDVNVCAFKNIQKDEVNELYKQFEGEKNYLMVNSLQNILYLIWLNVLFLLLHPYITFKYLQKYIAYALKTKRKAYLRTFFYAPLLYEKVKDNNYTHLHSHYVDFHSLAVKQISEMLKIPYSLTIHAYEIFVNRPSGYIDYLNEIFTGAQKIAVISEYNKKFILDNVNSSLEDKIEIIRCGINVKKQELPEKIFNEPLKMLSISVLKEKKGLIHLINALPLLENIPYSLTIVGEGPEKDKLISRTCELQLHNNVNFLDYLDNDKVYSFMKGFDVFILPAQKAEDGDLDGIPVVLMEAMYNGIPVVSTNVSGIPELVTGFPGTGMLCEPESPESLTNTINSFFHLSQNEKQEMIQNAKNKVIQDFNIDKEAERLKDKIFI